MTEGTSQGLFVVVAIVIFGIFIGLTYTLFGSEGLTNDLKVLFTNATEQANIGLTSSKTIFKGTNFTDKEVDAERFTPETGVAIRIDDDDLYFRQSTFRWDYRASKGPQGVIINLTDKELDSLQIGDSITFDYAVKSAYGGGNLIFNLGGDLKGSTKIQPVTEGKGYETTTTILDITEKTLSELKKGYVKITMSDLNAVVWFGKLDITINYN